VTLLERFQAALPRERKKAGITQEALAQKAGLSLGYVAALEAGRRTPSFEVVERIAGALGIPSYRLVQ